MRTVKVNGEPYRVQPLSQVDVRPGALLAAGHGNRKAMRVVCLDGGDAILRNLRFPSIVEVEPLDRITEYYDCIEPLF